MACYDPQGNVISGGPEPAWYPCNFTTSDGFAPCCQPALGACLPNLACAYSSDVLIRGGCTDFTFRSKNCPQFLLESDPAGFGNFIHNCGNGTGCYNANVAHSDHDCSCAPGSPNLLLINSNSIVYAEPSTPPTHSAAPAPVPPTTITTTPTPLPTPISKPTTTSTSTTTSSTSSTPSTSASTSVSQTISSNAAASSASSSSPVSSSAPTETTSIPISGDISSAVADQSTLLQSPSSLFITGTTAPTATASPQADGSNVGLKIGLPVGIIGGIALLAVIAAAIFWRRRLGGRKRDTVINTEPGLYMGTVNHHARYN